MKPETSEPLAQWQQRCKACGLTLTASREAILRALMAQTEAHDAVWLLQAAQTHHPATSIGTVYRFVRELEQRRLIDVYAQAHGRSRWQLRDEALSSAAHTAGDIRQMIAQVQNFLRMLEQMGLAQIASSNAPSPSSLDSDHALAVLHEIAGHLGYRLLPQRSNAA
jgi:Fur family ferric uptake transcriptional regulator